MSNDVELHVCHECVREAFLSQFIFSQGKVASCSYCENVDEECITIEDLADQVEGAFNRHYRRTSDSPDGYESMMLRDREISYEWERHGDPVLEAISDAASISDRIAEDVFGVLTERHSDFEADQIGEECEFAEESYYEFKNAEDHEFASEWKNIELSLKSEARFFNKDAERFLAKLFASLDGKSTKSGDPVIVRAGPGMAIRSFYRARVVQHSDDLDDVIQRPDLHLGTPPAAAARAGRMNAHGIAVFYGSSDEEVALAEVRPPVGSRAVVGEFELTRPIRLLDVTALKNLFVEGSIFDEKHLGNIHLHEFLGRLSGRIVIPVLPNDEATEYLITQSIADYLARKPEPGLDGMLFPSVQCEGHPQNVVLFHHASRVEKLAMPDGTETSSIQEWSTEDGLETDYTVWEQVPPGSLQPTDKPESKIDVGEFDYPPRPKDRDRRGVTLRVSTESIVVHHIESVKFSTDRYKVQRRRMEKREPDF